MERFNIAGALHRKLAALAPIHGVSIGRRDDKATWRIDFKDEATDQQKAAASAAFAAFDSAAEEAAEVAEKDRALAVEAKMRELATAMVDDPTLLARLRATK